MKWVVGQPGGAQEVPAGVADLFCPAYLQLVW